MHDWIKKAGSLVLGVGALGLALVHAAATHGCASSNTQAQAPAAEPAPSGADSERCKVPSYMYATKAPIWLPPECYGQPANRSEAPQQAPDDSNAAQQAQ